MPQVTIQWQINSDKSLPRTQGEVAASCPMQGKGRKRRENMQSLHQPQRVRRWTGHSWYDFLWKKVKLIQKIFHCPFVWNSHCFCTLSPGLGRTANPRSCGEGRLVAWCLGTSLESSSPMLGMNHGKGPLPCHSSYRSMIITALT